MLTRTTPVTRYPSNGSNMKKHGNEIHGMCGHPEYKYFYNSWCSMKRRCCNSNNSAFKHYGGRGIKVCKRWMKFENFRDDMFAEWKKGLSIERINVNGNYTPKNCKWIPKEEQSKNARTVKSIKNNLGQVFESQMDAARKTGVTQGKISMNLNGHRESAGKDKNGSKIKWMYT